MIYVSYSYVYCMMLFINELLYFDKFNVSKQQEVKMKTRILIIFGGNSSEYEISLQSSYGVLNNLDRDLFDPIPIGIDQLGQWNLYDGEYENILNNKWCTDTENLTKIIMVPRKDNINRLLICNGDPIEYDLAFPILHGKNGEDGGIQGLLKIYDIPFIGCKVMSSALCMDKFISHEVITRERIKTPKGFKFYREDNLKNILERISPLKLPLYVKPINGGSSIGITKVEDFSNIESAIFEAFKYDDEIIIEENIEGVEVGCAIIGRNNITIGAVDEVETTGHFFNYDDKYLSSNIIIHTPGRFRKDLEEKIKDTAIKIYKTLDCSGFARVDMFLTKDEEIVFNEVNTIPGLTPNSRFPRMMKFAGIDFKSLLTKIIKES